MTGNAHRPRRDRRRQPARLSGAAASGRPWRLLPRPVRAAHASDRVRAEGRRFSRGDDGDHAAGLLDRAGLAGGSDCLEPMQIGSVKALGIQKPWAPPRSYGLLVHLDADGEATDSLHSRAGGRFHGITARCATPQGVVIAARGAGRAAAATGRAAMNETAVHDRPRRPPPRPAASRCCASSAAARSMAASTPSRASISISIPARCMRWSARTAPANRRCARRSRARSSSPRATIYVDGKPVNFEQPRDALAAGICMVYQETSLVPTMTAAQNIELGNEKLLTRFRTLNIQAQQLLQSLNFHVDPATPVGAARHRQEADGRDRARDLQQGAHHHLRRADCEPDAGGDRPLLPSGARPARPRRRHHLHLAMRWRNRCRSPTASPCCATASW